MIGRSPAKSTAALGSSKTRGNRAGGRILARFHQDGESLVLKVEYAAPEVLMGKHPETFYVTDHYRCYPLMLVRLANVELSLLRALIEDAWRSLASKRDVSGHGANGRLDPIR